MGNFVAGDRFFLLLTLGSVFDIECFRVFVIAIGFLLAEC